MLLTVYGQTIITHLVKKQKYKKIKKISGRCSSIQYLMEFIDPANQSEAQTSKSREKGEWSRVSTVGVRLVTWFADIILAWAIDAVIGRWQGSVTLPNSRRALKLKAGGCSPVDGRGRTSHVATEPGSWPPRWPRQRCRDARQLIAAAVVGSHRDSREGCDLGLGCWLLVHCLTKLLVPVRFQCVCGGQRCGLPVDRAGGQPQCRARHQSRRGGSAAPAAGPLDVLDSPSDVVIRRQTSSLQNQQRGGDQLDISTFQCHAIASPSHCSPPP